MTKGIRSLAASIRFVRLVGKSVFGAVESFAITLDAFDAFIASCLVKISALEVLARLVNAIDQFRNHWNDHEYFAWQKLLKPRGYLAFTDAVWLTDNPAPEALAFWEASYPAMQNIADLLVACAAAGYEILGQFVLPESSWMENYYKPMEARIEALREKYRDNPPALLALDEEQAEIEIYRKYHDAYGYAFAVLRLL